MKLLAAAVAMVALWATPQVAAAQTGTAPFCLQTATGTRCMFSTMGECEAARGTTSADQCITRSDAQGTTGLGDRQVKPPDQPIALPPTTGR
jgi:hypothetical protein